MNFWLCTRYFANYFSYIISFNPYNNFMRKILLQNIHTDNGMETYRCYTQFRVTFV